jgi:WS/DGAT/MGAT family acyltransferase
MSADEMAAADAGYLSQNDSVMWTIEADPLLRSTIMGLVVLDRPPDWDALNERMERVTHHVPVLRQKVVNPPFHPRMQRWVWDPNFDLSYHLRRISLPAPGRLSDLLDIASTTAQHGLDRARPLWEFTLVEGLEDGGAALMMKAHHVVSDGIGSVQLAAHLFDFEPEPDEPGVAPSPPEASTTDRVVPLSPVELWIDALGRDAATVIRTGWRGATRAVPAMASALRHPRDAVTDAVDTAKSIGRTVAPVRTRLSPVMTERRMSTQYGTIDISLDELRRAAAVADGTVNDGFLAAITGAMRRYHGHHDADVDELRMAMPISLRTEDDAAGGNHVTVMRFKVPVGVAEPAERVRLLHEVGAEVRAEKSIPHTGAIAGALNLMPPAVLGSMLKRVDFLASNVPGTPVAMYLIGTRVRRFYPFGPTAGSSVNITLMSYEGTCCIGVNTDNAAIPDHELFMSCFEDGFAEVLALAET